MLSWPAGASVAGVPLLSSALPSWPRARLGDCCRPHRSPRVPPSVCSVGGRDHCASSAACNVTRRRAVRPDCGVRQRGGRRSTAIRAASLLTAGGVGSTCRSRQAHYDADMAGVTPTGCGSGTGPWVQRWLRRSSPWVRVHRQVVAVLKKRQKERHNSVSATLCDSYTVR